MTGRARVKVAFFLPNLQQGGSERQVIETIRGLPERFEPLLCLYNDTNHYDGRLPASVPRHVLGVERMDLPAFSRLVAILRRERPQIVHSYRDKANFWGRLAALAAHVPVIISSCRNRMIAPRHLLVEAFLARRTTLVTTNSVGVKDELTGLARVPAERIRILHNVIDIQHFRPPTEAERASARADWQASAHEKLVVMPGRIALQKHQLGLLLALRDSVRARQLPPHVRVLLAGRERDPNYSSLVRRVLGDPDVRSVVRYIGAQQDMRRLYWAADLLVLSSLWEGLPNVALEGCAVGLPCVLSRAANLDGIIEPGVGGWEVPTADRQQLARTLARALTRPRRELARMGQDARAHVLRHFSPEATIDAFTALYDELLAAQTA